MEKPKSKVNDKRYCELLKLACVTDNHIYNNIELREAVATLSKVTEYSQVHKRIMPLLWAKSKSLNIFKDLPNETQSLLSKCTQISIVTELAKKQQLIEILDALSVQKIPIIMLKGGAFNGHLYSKNCPRMSNDIDILVKLNDWDKAVEAVSKIMDYTEKTQPDIFGDLYEYSYKPMDKIGAALDLHKSISNPILFNLDENDIWATSMVCPEFDNENVRMLSAEYALIHQAIHGYTDLNFCKYNLVDTHEIINQLKPDMDLTLLKANECGASLSLFYLLQGCKKVMKTECNESVMKQLQPNVLTGYLAEKVLYSKYAHPMDNNKSIKYRINQVLSMFIFTNSIFKPLYLQYLFLKMALKNKLNKMRTV
jgi:hypothetical protein